MNSRIKASGIVFPIEGEPGRFVIDVKGYDQHSVTEDEALDALDEIAADHAADADRFGKTSDDYYDESKDREEV